MKAQNEASEERLIIKTNEHEEALKRLQDQLKKRNAKFLEETNALRNKLYLQDQVNKKLSKNEHLMKQNELFLTRELQTHRDYIWSLREEITKSELACKQYEQLLKLHQISTWVNEERIKKIHFRYRVVLLLLVVIAVFVGLYWMV